MHILFAQVSAVIAKLESDGPCSLPVFCVEVIQLRAFLEAADQEMIRVDASHSALEMCRELRSSIEKRMLGFDLELRDRRRQAPFPPAAVTAMMPNPYLKLDDIPESLRIGYIQIARRFVFEWANHASNPESSVGGQKRRQREEGGSGSSAPPLATSPALPLKRRNPRTWATDFLQSRQSAGCSSLPTQSGPDSVPQVVREYETFMNVTRATLSDMPQPAAFHEYWNAMALYCPNLSRLALELACMTATSASVERLFSSAGLIVTTRRASLSQDTAEVLVALKQNLDVLRKFGLLSDVRGRLVELWEAGHRA